MAARSDDDWREVESCSEPEAEVTWTSAVTVGWCLLFFFQAEDGIRDLTVTGVQTCALPISVGLTSRSTATSAILEGALVSGIAEVAVDRDVSPTGVAGIGRRQGGDLVIRVIQIGRASCRERV